jgi:O-antigen/teichoic acid export membrane protein
VSEIPGRLLAKNTALNLVCGGLPLLVGLVTIPYVIHGLGAERFGVLALAWVFSGYLGFLGLGLGPATTKFAAELLGKREHQTLPSLLWTAVILSAGLGLVATALLTFASPYLVDKVFKLNSSTLLEGRRVFQLIALSFPFVFAQGPLRGLLGAAQRFDLLNAISLPLSTANYLIPAVAVWLGFGLPAIVGTLLVIKAIGALAYLILDLRIFPHLREQFRVDPHLFGTLLGFGGWVSVDSILSPIISYLDRFLIGALISMAAVSYYTAPCEAMMRAAVIPAALIGVLFPAFSFWQANAKQQEIQNAFVRSFRYILLTMGPLAVFTIFFSREILTLWLGPDFATQATAAFQILACTLLVVSVGWLPHALLQAVGRPDIPSKLLLLEVPLYIAGAWFLITRNGIAGAAIAFVLRAVIHAVLLFLACFRLKLATWAAFTEGLTVHSGVVVGGLALGFAALSESGFSLPANALACAVLSLAFGFAAWHFAIHLDEKVHISSLLRRVYSRS